MELKSVFQENVRRELLERISSLQPESKGNWGKMNVYQMTKHNCIWNEWVLGKSSLRFTQGILGKLFGKMVIARMTRDNKPMGKGAPAGKDFIVTEKTGSLETQKSIWSALILEYAHYDNPDFVHEFFGKISREKIGILVYKHTDHHLRQFNS